MNLKKSIRDFDDAKSNTVSSWFSSKSNSSSTSGIGFSIAYSIIYTSRVWSLEKNEICTENLLLREFSHNFLILDPVDGKDLTKEVTYLVICENDMNDEWESHLRHNLSRIHVHASRQRR